MDIWRSSVVKYIWKVRSRQLNYNNQTWYHARRCVFLLSAHEDAMLRYITSSSFQTGHFHYVLIRIPSWTIAHFLPLRDCFVLWEVMVLKASPRPKRECPRLVYRDLGQSGFWKFAKVVCYVYNSHTSGKRGAPVTSLLISDDILWEYIYM